MKISEIAFVAYPVIDIERSRGFYEGVLGLQPSREFTGESYAWIEYDLGANTFAVWPLAQAAESCFGTSEWPADTAVPHAWLEFDVDDIEAATRELEEQGYRLLVRNRTEPWGQVVTRLLSPEGLLVGVTVTPWMRGESASP